MKTNPRIHPRAAVWMLTALFTMSLLLGLFQTQRVQALEHQVTAAYQKAFFETVTLMDGISTGLSKLMVSGSAAKEQELLGSISRQADAAQDNLSMLPAGLPSVAESLKFVNQLGDYASTLSDRLAAGGEVTDNDRELLMTLQNSCQSLIALLSDLSEEIQSGGNPFADASAVQAIDLPLNDDTEPAIEYPALLYDGPFSDGRNQGEIQAPGGALLGREQALELARDFIGRERVLSVRITGEGSVPVPCYEITAAITEGEMNLAVTRQGGQVVYLMSSRTGGEARFTQAELIDLAASFLKSRNYPEAAVSYWSLYNNLLTVNFAAVQDGVILYPDLIKVQMDASTGLISGFEALNYLTNHTRRENLSPTLTPEKAESLINPVLDVQKTRLCVIPTDAGEALCYEISAQADGSLYLIYIDAHTGLEREIYLVIEDETGQLAL